VLAVYGMVSGAQIRAARALLDWTATRLAEESGVSRMTVQRFEKSDGIPRGRLECRQAIQVALEKAGITFSGSPVKMPGVRLALERRLANE
jgi:transcriptional regulator with XRE-family HTH domain